MADPRRNRGPFRIPRLTIPLGLILLAASCGGGGPGPAAARDETDLTVVSFSHDGRTDVYRNQPLTITFSGTVEPSSVTDRTIRIRTGPNLRTVAAGRLKIDGNVVTFDPRRSVQDLDRRTRVVETPFGFDALATVQVLVVGPPAVKRVTNRAGDGVLGEFFATFRTGDEYVPERTPPRFVGDVEHGRPGRLAFGPVQDPDGAIRQDSSFVLVFDEAIDPATMDPGGTVLVRKMLVGGDFEDDVPGTFSHDASARRWTFEPAFGIGRGPFDVVVTLTPGVRDLAGNPLGPVALRYRTAVEPNVPDNGTISESFETTAYRDPAGTTGDWNGSKPGWLRGGAITTSVIEIRILPTDPGMAGGSRLLLKTPLTDAPEGSRSQMLYLQSEIGEAGTITDVAWGPENNALFAASHPRLIMRLGHDSRENLTSTFADNYDVGAPVRVYDGPYAIPQRANIKPPGLDDGYWPFPAFTTFFDYDGKSNLVIDVDVMGGTNWQSHRIFYGYNTLNVANAVVSRRRLHGTFGAEEGTVVLWNPPGNPEPSVPDAQITKRRRRTLATSTWYDSGVTNANYGTPIVSPPTQPGGAVFSLRFEGAKAMKGTGAPDPATFTGFVDSIDLLDGYRYVRFEVVLEANLFSDTVPEISSITLPFTF